MPLRISKIASKQSASARNVMIPATQDKNQRRERRREVLVSRTLEVSNPVDPRLSPDDPIVFVDGIRSKDSTWQCISMQLLGFTI